MGNCQAIDAATLVIQHPSGKEDKLYWPITASEVMRSNPGHYVALLISTTLYPPPPPNNNNNTELPSTTATNTDTTSANSCPVRLTKIKLLRPTDMLVLGHVYRLITTQEVMKGLKAKKHAKLKKGRAEVEEKAESVKDKKHGSGVEIEARRSHLDKENQADRNGRNRPSTATTSRTTSSNHSAAVRSRTWQPSLNSISEAAS